MSGPYDDIIHLSRPFYPDRSKMSRYDRAAQFAPFAALTGHGATVAETARYTQQRIEPDENRKSELNSQLQLLHRIEKMNPSLSVLYFVPDARKTGGAYVTAAGQLLAVKAERECLLFTDGTTVPFADILTIDSPAFLPIPNEEEAEC